jgi:hypothetical protein
MSIVQKLSVSSSLLLAMALPALAEVNVNNPANNSLVESPFSLSATAITCSSEPVASIRYSLDNGPDAVIVQGTSLDETVTSPAGTHTLHVKAWGEGGAVCAVDVDVTVNPEAEATNGSSMIVPSNALKNSSLQVMSNWEAIGDSGAKGKAHGSTTIVNSPSLSGTARKFTSVYSGNGDERFSLDFGEDGEATNFAYDGWLYLNSTENDISNVEMDMNQVMSNGQTVIYGVQCDGWSGTWDYTINAGTVTHQIDKWVHTNLPCDPHTWEINTWHHFQATYSRNSEGVVTYHSVWFDGVEYTFNATGPSAVALNWGPSLVTNFQMDGFNGSGTSTIYVDRLTIYRW